MTNFYPYFELYMIFRRSCILEINLINSSGLTVISVVADSCSINRKFLFIHKIPQYLKSSVTYLAPNISLPSNKVYFMAYGRCSTCAEDCIEHLLQLSEQWHIQLIDNYIEYFCLYNCHCGWREPFEWLHMCSDWTLL